MQLLRVCCAVQSVLDYGYFGMGSQNRLNHTYRKSMIEHFAPRPRLRGRWSSKQTVNGL